MNNTYYAMLDQPNVLRHLFHPRAEESFRQEAGNREDIMIPIDDNTNIGASFHLLSCDAPVLLVFHGNGEIVSDYDDFGSLFNKIGINFLVVDYRGYGRSNGTPSVTSMMNDCHKIFDFVVKFMQDKKLTGTLSVMGRSLGSASAIELAATRADEFKSLIIESGFAKLMPLLQTLGIDLQGPDLQTPDLQTMDFKEQSEFENVEKIKIFTNPCLVIHAQFDHIIPFSDGQALFDACDSRDKTLLEIKGANHNDIFFKGMDQYMKHIKNIAL